MTVQLLEVDEATIAAAMQRLEESEQWGDAIDVAAYMRDTHDFGYSASLSPVMTYTQIDDRADGAYRPVYRTEPELKLIRAMSWLLYERVPMAKAWVERLLDYTIGTGFDWSVKCEDEALRKAIKRVADRLLRQNKWSMDLERESYAREVTDGECLLELEWHGCDVEIVTREADELTEPASHRELDAWLNTPFVPSWTFGVHTQQTRPDRPLGYHLVRDSAGRDWNYVPASKFCHWKRNVRRTAKRGYGDFYTPHQYLLHGDRVITSTSVGAAIQASIAYIVEHAKETDSSKVATMQGLRRYTGRYDPQTGYTDNRAKYRPGMRLDVKNGQTYHAGPLGDAKSEIYIAVLSAALRLAGTVKAFPEGMLNGDYSNNNMASSLVAQSPFVQGRVAEQFERATKFRELIEKSLALYAQAGAFREFGIDRPAQLWARAEIVITPPKVIPLDRKALAEGLQVERANGWCSQKTAMQELGRDEETETANMEEERAKGIMPPAMGLPGMPGQQPGQLPPSPGQFGQQLQQVLGGQPGQLPQPGQQTPQGPGVPGGLPEGNVQSTALNGAQVTSLVDVVAQVGAKRLPIESARAILTAAFPAISPETINQILQPIINQPQPPEPPQAIPGQQPPPEGAARSTPGQPPDKPQPGQKPPPPKQEGRSPWGRGTKLQESLGQAWKDYP